jgi:hypothetical protein
MMSMMQIEGSGSASGSGSIGQRHGYAETDPDPHQNVMDLQHWFLVKKLPLPWYDLFLSLFLGEVAVKYSTAQFYYCYGTTNNL